MCSSDLACETNDNAYDGHYATAIWDNTSGTRTTSIGTYNTTDTTTEVAFVPPMTNAVALISFESSVAIQAGDNMYIGVTGMVADATKRRGHIAAAATVALDDGDGLLGIGSIEVVQKTDQVGTDGGHTYEFDYVTIWGALKSASVDLDAADTTTAVYPVDSDGATIKDFWRLRDDEFDMLATDELFIQRLTVFGAAAIYAVVKAANYKSVHTRFGATTTSYLGNIEVGFPTVGELLTVQVTYTPYGETLAQVLSMDYLGHGILEVAERLQPGTEVKILINDGAVAGANANVIARYLDVQS